MSGRRGLVVPQNTFLDSIIRKTNGNHEHFLLASAQVMDAPIVFCSDGFTKLTGYKKHLVMKKKACCSFLYGSLTTKDSVRLLQEAIDCKQSAQLEILLYKKDSTPFWVLLNIGLVTDDRDDSVLFLMTFQDISQYKEPMNPSNKKHRWLEFIPALHTKSMADNPNSPANEEKNRHHIAELMEDNVKILPDYKQEIPDTPRYLILHCCTAKIVWDWFILIFILYTATSIPFIVCFKFNSVPMTITGTVVDFMFLVDIVLNFHTSYVGDDGAIVFDLQQIRRTYLRSWFCIDLVTSLPYGLLGLFTTNVERGITDFIGFLKAIRLLRLNRVVRALDQYLEYGFITLVLWMLFFCLCAHWMACIFFAIAEHYDNFADVGWVRLMSDQTQQPLVIVNGTAVETPTIASLYMSSLYFSLTSLTSIGFGNIAPNTTAEKIFSCVTMIFGGLCYAVIFGQVTAIIQQTQKKSETYHQTLENMRSFCKLYQVPKEISTRITDYYMYTWVLNRGVDTNQVLVNCPKDLQSDICIHLNRKIIDSTPAFGKLSNAVLRAVARNFAIHRVAPGERVVHEGESLDTLYFIGSGSFEVTQQGKVVGLLGEGDVFGDDICRFSDVGRSVADVFALTYANMHAIGRDELLGALAFYPEYGAQFGKVFTLSYSLRDEVTMKRLSAHPRRNQVMMDPKGVEVRRFSIVEEMQHVFDSNSNDIGPLDSQNVPDTDLPSKPFNKLNKARLSDGNIMEGIPEGSELDSGINDDEDLRHWDNYQKSEELLNMISGMKSEVRREIEIMSSKMNQLEQNISTILSLLQDRGLKSAAYGFNLLPPETPLAKSSSSRTASIVSRVKADMPEEVLPDWVEMENFGMAGNGDVVKCEDEAAKREDVPKRVGGKITKERKPDAKRKNKKAEKITSKNVESKQYEPAEVAHEDLLDGRPSLEYLEEGSTEKVAESLETTDDVMKGKEKRICKKKKDKISKKNEEVADIEMNDVVQNGLLKPPTDKDLERLSYSSHQEDQTSYKAKKKPKKKKGEKKRKKEEKKENEGEANEPRGGLAQNGDPREDYTKIDFPRAERPEEQTESPENKREGNLPESKNENEHSDDELTGR